MRLNTAFQVFRVIENSFRLALKPHRCRVRVSLTLAGLLYLPAGEGPSCLSGAKHVCSNHP